MASSLPQTPVLTVIIATYNAAGTVAKCIDSLLAQTEPVQIIVVDGMSTDRTGEIAAEYVPQGVEIIREADRGVYDAWNKGLLKARGEWIVFLGADDFYADPRSLETLSRALSAATVECAVAYGTVKVVDCDGVVVKTENGPWSQCVQRLRINMPYTHVGSAHRRTLFRDRMFDASYRIAGDYHFLFPILASTTPLYVPHYSVMMGNGGLSTSPSARLVLLRELRSIRAMYSIALSRRHRAWTAMKFAYYRLRQIAV